MVPCYPSLYFRPVTTRRLLLKAQDLKQVLRRYLDRLPYLFGVE